MKRLAALISISAVVVGCLNLKVPDSDSRPTPVPTPIVIARPVLAPVHKDKCLGHPVNPQTGVVNGTLWNHYDACFTHEEWAKLVSEMTELHKEAGR